VKLVQRRIEEAEGFLRVVDAAQAEQARHHGIQAERAAEVLRARVVA